MKKAERLSKIYDLLISQGEVNVEDLREKFGVSSVTIRNDLNQLEAEGCIQRTYGGAVLTQPVNQAFLPRSIIRSEILQFGRDKEAIALVAARDFVKDGDWIFIGCGDTCAAVAQALINRRVNVVTNSILVAAILSMNPNAVVQMTGGTLCGYDRHFLYGDQFVRALEGIHVKTAFLGASGADFKGGFTSYSDFERSIFEMVHQVSDQMIFVLGSSKFGTTSFLRIAPLDIADAVISDDHMPEEYQTYFQAHDISVALAKC